MPEFYYQIPGKCVSEVMQGRGLKDYKTDLQEILQQNS